MSLPVAAVVTALEAMHGRRQWHWWPDAPPFEVCVGAILVQNTAWANVERALAELRSAAALHPGAMAQLGDARLQSLVRPSGQFRQKTRKLRSFLTTCQAAGGFEALLDLPADQLRARLLATWGIGPETADCILCYAAGQPALVVDAYTVRLFRRLGTGPGDDSYEAWQAWLAAELATPPGQSLRDHYARVHALIVLHAKHLCRKRAPRCGDCLLRPSCQFAVTADGPSTGLGAPPAPEAIGR
jgi:endonuclease-3 related protein